MKTLFEKSVKKISTVPGKTIRDFRKTINWDNRLIALKGSRGVGKTTLLLQHIKQTLPFNEQTLYVSLDNIFFSGNTLIDLADSFVKNGGQFLFLDEVHRYRNWSQEIKNIYDDYPELHVVFTGSSVLQIKKSGGDLSRRAVYYNLPGLSLREYIKFSKGIEFSAFSLEDIINNHIQICSEIISRIKPIAVFNEYLKYGYYPFFMEGKPEYYGKLSEIVNTILEVDLPNTHDISFLSIEKLKKLLYIISVSVPFSPNIQKLSENTGITRNTIVLYLNYLQEARIIDLLYTKFKGISLLQKPEKIYLHHPNLHYALAGETTNTGSIRESFFSNQLSFGHSIISPEKGDFKVDNKYIFEVGGRDKNFTQITDISNSFIAADNIEIGYKNTVPLWLFGFLY